MRYAFFLALIPVVLVAVWAFQRTPARTWGKNLTPAPLPPVPPHMQEATFAAGCFWGVQQAFEHLPGVITTTVGYTGGHTVNPSYEEVCTDQTGHAEAVRVIFDPSKISYPELLDAFWSCHDPTEVNRQGPDTGSQYRSAIFTHSPEQAKDAKESLAQVEAAHVFRDKIATEITPAGPFYPAEEYHQDYVAKTGAACHTQGPAKVHTPLGIAAAKARQLLNTP